MAKFDWYDADGDPRLFSDACQRNRGPILEVLREVLPETGLVLETGCGTGQHAAYFGENLPDLVWQPTDRDDRAQHSVRGWVEHHGAENVRPPLVFDLFGESPVESADAIVCINTIHIAPWGATRKLFEHAAALLAPGAPIVLYGPFRYRDRDLEPSNVRFDQWLRRRDPESGIRTFEDVDAIARELGFELGGDRAMPANNRTIWWHRVSK
jgi:SAM-dependent methyltransferase